jgi:hypothetical protein
MQQIQYISQEQKKQKRRVNRISHYFPPGQPLLSSSRMPYTSSEKGNGLHPSNFSPLVAFFCRQRQTQQTAEKKNKILQHASISLISRE